MPSDTHGHGKFNPFAPVPWKEPYTHTHTHGHIYPKAFQHAHEHKHPDAHHHPRRVWRKASAD